MELRAHFFEKEKRVLTGIKKGMEVVQHFYVTKDASFLWTTDVKTTLFFKVPRNRFIL